ncbi:hypothetical protein B9Q13_05620 [Candidatus Marsarchaeota G2 archaeon ECH_B_SAG-G16]|uniref:Riboflavin kinase n=7 Tax=Candidatus Marsarchaeota TaxID=1978152 RepID=A0A2R6C3L9_9ARCH|nr:MAG: hypothetical protein B9Q01_01080 [Candidatus Marsarchaeota G1 archaeon OSP_D]PSN86855.1 MAG: hypothetical protein B9Q02_00100 [Candidatus Marsarchaeota G1 archaeon BE_D]PSN89115.1 MAG: hypothetical protein B9Q00_02520 [Candidatus Marsarchaeota G1 archaeon OSP_C]PSO03261.1 MAG: hypothetical protein B9Q10_00530 [Candidatus Marsarchaeota G2 archaeon ECH_B_SAG-E12]PSO04118.1 MAG: hypothetical protein B9Q13_05620 [Candidatus Marsarchaeota G2 archaeon ECH_B_SAG-G16]PSO05482.1 MAG: hypothetic
MVAIKRTILGKPGERWFDFADVIVALIEFGGMNGFVRISGSSLGSLLGISQQAASKRLIKASEAGFIEKRITTMGYEFTISEKTKCQIRGFIDKIMLPLNDDKIKAVVVSGVGEGKFFLELPGYKRQFEQIYGFKPYPGTLNLKSDQNVFQVFRKYPAKIINGFRKGDRVYGLVVSYNARIYHGNEFYDCVAIFPEISRYGDDVVECIAPVNLRKKLQLKDADVVYIEPRL